MLKKTLPLATLLAFGGQLALAQTSDSNREGRMRSQVVYYSRGEEPPSMDVNRSVDAVSGMWLGHMFEGLMTTNKAGQIVPGTAEKMDVSDDGLTYTFTLRKEARWHDGKPVTAQDFEFSFKRLVDPVYASEYAFIAETAGIVNATEVQLRKAPPESLGVTGFRVVSEAQWEGKTYRSVIMERPLRANRPVRFDVTEERLEQWPVNHRFTFPAK